MNIVEPHLPAYMNLENKSINNSLHDKLQSNIYNQNLMNTQMFQKNIDISCDDHTTKENLNNVEATRFCTECNVLICDTCVLDYHMEHVDKAKVKILDFIKNSKKELETLSENNKNFILHKKFLIEIDDEKQKKIEEIKKFFSKKRIFYCNLQDKISSLQQEEIDNEKKIIEYLEEFYHDNCYKKLDNPIKKLDESKSKIYKLLIFIF